MRCARFIFVILLGAVLLLIQQESCTAFDRQSIRGGLDSFIPFDVAADGLKFDLKPSPGVRYPAALSLYYDQIGLVLVAEYANGVKVRLPYHFDIGYDFDGEVYWEKRTNRYALAQYDLNGDGVGEILFAVVAPSDDGMSQVEVSVIEYHPPLREVDLFRHQNWEVASNIKARGVIGPVGIVLDGASIKIPRNHRGFYYELSWFKGEYRDTGDY